MKYNQGSVYCFADAANDSVKESLADVDVDNLPADALIAIEIPIFREGKFEHPYYDTLDFDEDYLNKLVENHKRRVLPRDVAFDTDHRKFDGRAAAWVRTDIPDPLELRSVDVPSPDGKPRKMKVLFAKIHLNRHGARLVKGNEYKYFSSEIHPNYTTREQIKLAGGKKGNDDLATIEHGPVLLGGGLTNNPFIPGLGEYEFSGPEGPVDDNGDVCFVADDGSGIHLFSWPEQEVEEEGNEGNAEDVEPASPPADSYDNSTTFGDNPMNFADVLQKFATADSDEQRLRILEDAAIEFSSDAAHTATITALKATTQKTIEDKMAFDNIVAENQRNVDRAKRLAEDNAKLIVESAKAKETSHVTRVELFCEDLRGANQHESIVTKAREVLLNSPTETRDAVFKFDADGDDTFSLMDVLKEVLSALPKEARLDTSESLANKEDKLRKTSPTPETDGGESQFSDESGGADEEAAVKAKVDKFVQAYGWEPSQEDLQYIDNDGVYQPVPVKE